MNGKYWIIRGLNTISQALKNASTAFHYSANYREGMWLVRSSFGYTVQIDEFVLPFDLSWGEADELRKCLEKYEKSRTDSGTS